MDEKKELVKKVLEKLKWHRDMAGELILLLDSTYCTERIVDSIIAKVNLAIKTAKDENNRNMLKKWLALIQKIRQKEENQKINDEELDRELDNLLDSM